MRIRTRTGGSQNDSTSACTTFGSGETQDYVVTIIAAGPCTSPPTSGTTVASATTVCPGSTLNLSLNGNSTGSGQTYQWQSSANGTSWTPIAGATLPLTTVTVSAATYYSCVLSCSSQSSTSSSVLVSLNPFYQCYCTNGIGGGCATSAIDSVSIATTGFNNGPTGCSANNYTMYPVSAATTATLSVSQAYTVNTRYTGNVVASLWIDYNQNGTFDMNEWTQLCTTSTALTNVASSITIPASASIGITGMRIRSRTSGNANDSTSSCSTFGSGETEDYVVTLVPFVAGIKTQAEASQLYVFPNPTNGIVNIAMNMSNASKLNYQVISITGETIYNEQTNVTGGTVTKTFDLSPFAKGVYFIRIVTDKEILMKKVIMQ